MMYAKDFYGMLGANQSSADSAMTRAVTTALQPYMPAIQQALIQAAEPAAQKAVEVAKPAMQEALADYAPKAITIVAALFIAGLFTGIYTSRDMWRKEMKRKPARKGKRK